MLNAKTLAFIYGLASAASWGAGDFSGGLATKRNHILSVIIISQLVGIVLLFGLALAFGEPIPLWRDWLLGGLAGISGALGLMALYSALASGRMGIVAPVAAVTTGSLPILASFLMEGIPAAAQLAGLGIALPAVWFLSRSGDGRPAQWKELGLPIMAGLGFGLFFILVDQISVGVVLWPLVSARATSISLLTMAAVFRGQKITPPRRQLPLVALAGILDSGGNGFFLLAAQIGRLDVASVLASLYPAMTIFLAWLVLKERLIRQQAIGVLLAITALILIAL